MELNSKQLMMMAVIGAAAWYLLRKKTAASSGSGLGGVMVNNKTPLQVGTVGAVGEMQTNNKGPLLASSVGSGLGDLISSIAGSYAPPVAGQAMPIAPAASGAVWGGTVSGGSPAITSSVSASGVRTYSDGSTYQLTDAELYAYNQQQKNGIRYAA